MINSFALKFFNSRRKRAQKRNAEFQATLTKKKQLALKLFRAPLSFTPHIHAAFSHA